MVKNVPFYCFTETKKSFLKSTHWPRRVSRPCGLIQKRTWRFPRPPSHRLDSRVSRLVCPTSYAVIHKLLKGTHTVVPTYNHAFEGCSTTAYKGQRGDTSRSAKLPNWQSSSESQRRATSGQGFLPSDMHKIWSGWNRKLSKTFWCLKWRQKWSLKTKCISGKAGTLCSRNFQNVKLRLDFVEMCPFYCHSDSMWNQILVNLNGPQFPRKWS